MSNIVRAWRASFTRRWHSNPDLCDTVDPVSGHQQRVALLLLLIYPDCSKALLAAAVTHDQGEAATGDVSYCAKEASPALRELLVNLEEAELVKQDIPTWALTEREARILKVCDWLDAYLWMRMHKPHLAMRLDWEMQRDLMVREAKALGLEHVSETVFGQAR